MQVMLALPDQVVDDAFRQRRCGVVDRPGGDVGRGQEVLLQVLNVHFVVHPFNPA